MTPRKQHPALEAAELPPARQDIRPMSTAHVLSGRDVTSNGTVLRVEALLDFVVSAVPDTEWISSEREVRGWISSVREMRDCKRRPLFNVDIGFEGDASKQTMMHAELVTVEELHTIFETMIVLRARMQAAGFEV